MQTDMHYYGTYAIARLVGFTPAEAETIAYSAQYVDDSTHSDSSPHPKGGLLFGIATAHHGLESIKNAFTDKEEQRRVWVPFHFIPGNQGASFQERLICRKNSDVAQTMFFEHSKKAIDCEYGLHLMGIACHTYADTFSHYGFSGISSDYNKVIPGSVQVAMPLESAEFAAEINTKFLRFMERYPKSKLHKWINKLLGNIGNRLAQGLGHGSAATYPDRPFLTWEMTYQHTSEHVVRNNSETFMEAVEHLYDKLLAFAKARNPELQPNGNIYDPVIHAAFEEIISYQAFENDRIDAWRALIKSGKLFEVKDERLNYNPGRWETQKKQFSQLPTAEQGIKLDVYKFHQAAAYHRYYVLKDLLPRYGIAVY